MTNSVYLHYPANQITGDWYGMETLPHLGLVGYLRNPTDESVLMIGREITLNIVNGYEPDLDEAASGMRLRALALGYGHVLRRRTGQPPLPRARRGWRATCP